MKIVIDTKDKIIEVPERVNLAELMDKIKKLLPNKEWKEYDIQTSNTYIWNPSPIYISTWPLYPYHHWWLTGASSKVDVILAGNVNNNVSYSPGLTDDQVATLVDENGSTSPIYNLNTDNPNGISYTKADGVYYLDC